MGPSAAGPIRDLLSLETLGIKLGLDQIRALLSALSRPDRSYPSIIVAGTNGKGSVTAMVERGLRAAGRRTGRFTSPHLVDLEERFAVDGEPIATTTLSAAAARIIGAARRLPHPPTFFEATAAVALDVFREAGVEVAVLEVGLGGRLDATNAVDAVAAAITSVDFDHESYLGHTLDAIAREKAGVLRPGALAVLATNPPEVEQAVLDVAGRVGARVIRCVDGVSTTFEMVNGRAHGNIATPVRTYQGIELALRGRHQVDNAVCAVRLLEALGDVLGIEVSPAAVRAAVEDVVWPARLEAMRVAGVEVIVDGAHNAAGARALAAFVDETYGRRVPIVAGMMRDKPIDALIGALAGAAACFVFTAASTARAAAPTDLARTASRVAPDVPAMTEDDPCAAVRRAAAVGAPVIVAGSLYLAGEVRAARS